MRFAAGFVAKVFATPLPQVLAMKISDFDRWYETARDVWEATRPKFE
ncbi:hypothetical protein [Thalassovita aquimarina]|uniref:Uncharacterized protein n=1 Tax=Thalassovita aquimarina TaxID=2785917 RepID=A0ABS5HSH2_9RHOB|nr:hypothetical protein [Thalassovita aquimarina]MBR9651924.1 hypothetical protein [Thalassovita aquimarina]